MGWWSRFRFLDCNGSDYLHCVFAGLCHDLHTNLIWFWWDRMVSVLKWQFCVESCGGTDGTCLCFASTDKCHLVSHVIWWPWWCWSWWFPSKTLILFLIYFQSGFLSSMLVKNSLQRRYDGCVPAQQAKGQTGKFVRWRKFTTVFGKFSRGLKLVTPVPGTLCVFKCSQRACKVTLV